MMIYAIFLCLPIGCQQMPIGMHILPNGQQTSLFASRAECDHALRREMPAPDINSGHYRCMGRHIETWR